MFRLFFILDVRMTDIQKKRMFVLVVKYIIRIRKRLYICASPVLIPLVM